MRTPEPSSLTAAGRGRLKVSFEFFPPKNEEMERQLWQALQRLAPHRRKLDADLYGQAYREVGLRRLRRHQIDLIAEVGVGLARAVKTPGVATLLKLSRGPARATGLGDLQGFLERGFAAFAALGDGKAFVRDIERAERTVSRRLFAGDPDPFRD